jgi:hypothetical protein
MPNPDKPEITNYKHQITNPNIQISNKIRRQLFGILNFGIVICLVFVICYLKFFITETRTLTPETFDGAIKKMIISHSKEEK